MAKEKNDLLYGEILAVEEVEDWLDIQFEDLEDELLKKRKRRIISRFSEKRFIP